MKTIQLTRGQVAIVDDADFDALARFTWTAVRGRKTWYAIRAARRPDGRKTTVKMHRVVVAAPAGVEVDHINLDGLDNRRSNLRLATASENRRNRGAQRNNTSGYKGVSWHSIGKKWRASIKVFGVQRHLGLFATAAEAFAAYCAASERAHGAFRRTA